jgi:CHAT domain-containing protein
MIAGPVAGPFGVLIVGSNPGDLPQVREEIEEVRELFINLYRNLGWPEEKVTLIDSASMPSAKAMASKVQMALLSKEDQIHILHFAGHGKYDDGRPALALCTTTGEEELIPAPTLRNWVSKSDLRFVYLGSCSSVGVDLVASALRIRQFDNLGQAVASAGVPEILGFRWPISDRQSRAFAKQFYTSYLRSFNASVAALWTRSDFKEDNKIWPAPVVIQNIDSIPIDMDA